MPPVTPSTSPVSEPTVATAVLLLLQLPPVIEFTSVIVAPLHTVVGPVIGPGARFTVTTAVTKQPVDSV